MKVKLINYSKYINDTENNLEFMVAYCARVSNPLNQLNNLNNEKLINYLITHNHWSPFEMVSICLEINTSRDIARQMLRHRSFSFQEFSQRYAVVENDFIVREARLQDEKNRQNSIDTLDENLKEEWNTIQKRLNNEIYESYKWALDNGIAREQARSILPEGNTRSRLYMSGTLRSWIHYIELRSGNGSQKEHVEIAVECAEVIKEIFPMIMNFVKVK